ncbi:hypothetical protein T12_5707 [Trichinella patagoniensis]|uniref:Uncharacterized protein n=1 Tax=Trichinella patagoniensis TaxID=990121 RepID=A0A0V0YVU7_9BILA|nr:hypothetical protein T12_5707 [Trichinella patagoniensis]
MRDQNYISTPCRRHIHFNSVALRHLPAFLCPDSAERSSSTAGLFPISSLNCNLSSLMALLYFSVRGTNLDTTASIRKFYRAIWQSAAQHRSKSMVARVG